MKPYRCHPNDHVWWLDPLLRNTRWCVFCGACNTLLDPPPTHPSILKQCLTCYKHWWSQELFFYPRCPQCREKYWAEMKVRLKAKFRPQTTSQPKASPSENMSLPFE